MAKTMKPCFGFFIAHGHRGIHCLSHWVLSGLVNLQHLNNFIILVCTQQINKNKTHRNRHMHRPRQTTTLKCFKTLCINHNVQKDWGYSNLKKMNVYKDEYISGGVVYSNSWDFDVLVSTFRLFRHCYTQIDPMMWKRCLTSGTC